MKTYDDNNIEILGSSYKPEPESKGRSKVAAWLLAALAVIIAAIACFAIASQKREPEAAMEEATEISADPATAAPAIAALATEADSINDVALLLTSVDGAKAEVSFEFPCDAPDSVLLATPAADYRADNGEIVGDFIIGMKQVSRGVRKEGWCYVSPSGSITIGIGSADEAKQAAHADGGCFFRQYALVMDGEICPQRLKGKAKRRAIGFLNGTPVIARSANRESIYDFAQALADYGFSHAIYLPGGDCQWLLKGDQGVELIEKPVESPYANYLIFKAE